MASAKSLFTRQTWLLLGTCLGLLLPYVLLVRFAQPFWDDYDYASLVNRLGSHQAATSYLYEHHSGRIGSFLLARLNPLAWRWPQGLPLVLAGLLLATGLVHAWALRVLTRQQLPWVKAGVLAAALLLGQLWVMPSLYSAFYWFSSAMVYQVPIILNVGWPLAVLQSLRAQQRWRRAAWYGLAAGAVLLVATTNELALVLLGWCLSWLSGLALRTRQWGALRRWLGLAGLVLAAGVVVVAAPGNLVRLHQSALHVTVPLWRAAWHAVRIGGQFLASPQRLLALLMLPLLLAPLAYQYRHLRPVGLRLSGPQAALFVAGSLAVQLLFLSLISWGYPAGRTLNFIWASLLGCWLVAGWALVPSAGVAPRWLTGSPRAIALLGCLGLGILGPELAAWREWLGNAGSWQQQLVARDAAIRAARQAGIRSVRVSPVQGVRPQHVLIIGEMLSTDARVSYNQDMARWYGLDSLQLSQPGLPPPDVYTY